ncbi:hypothetical protein HF995_04330 [Sanguibacter hominis ATCC BAA-789]|uniref:Right handed beta helix domain-containing protein n=1 Tax=Sanguibacter hominis ATCC BAA-789 TaxID=1312740 RepID=A0A9X5INU8_9MICO|nr:hypothetical protein [Sanguibacter hominis]NKX92507.1 hypothetical protein [Sanguibacter hominis ATCC BAA-789]
MPRPLLDRSRRRQRRVTATFLVAMIAAASIGATAIIAPTAEQTDVAELFPPEPPVGVDDGVRTSLTGRSDSRLPVDTSVSTGLPTSKAGPSAGPTTRLGRPWHPLRGRRPPVAPTTGPTPPTATAPPTTRPTTAPPTPGPTSTPSSTPTATEPDPSTSPTKAPTKTPNPTKAPPTTTPPAPKPPATSRPDGSSTGVPAGTKLKVHEGDLTVTQRGAVVDRLDVRGAIRVQASDVTIKNTIVRGRPVSSIFHLVQISENARGTRIVDSEIFGANPSPYVMGVVGSSFTLERVNIHTVIDQVTIIGKDVTIKSSWLHDNLSYAQDPNHNGGPSHDDNIQIQVGSNLLVTGSRLEGSSSAAVMITQGRGKVSGTTVENSWIDGGSCSVNIAELNQGPLSGLTFRNNVFGTSTRHPYCALLVPSTTTVTQSGNSFADGTVFRVSKG